MDNVTQQNAALVEEVTATVAALEDQAEELSVFVATFKLSGIGSFIPAVDRLYSKARKVHIQAADQ